MRGWSENLISFVLFLSFFLLLFPRGKGYFNLLEVRDSSSTVPSMTYVSILEAYNSFDGGCEGLGISKK